MNLMDQASSGDETISRPVVDRVQVVKEKIERLNVVREKIARVKIERETGPGS